MREVSTDDGPGFEHGALCRPQLLDAGRERRVDRRRQLDSTGVDRGFPLVVDAPQHAVVHEQAQQLAKEQRISFAGVNGPASTPGGIASVASKSSAMRCAASASSGPRRTTRPDGPPTSTSEGRRSRSSGRAKREDEHRAACPLCDVLDQIQQRGLGPVHVVDQEHDRRLLGQRLDEPAQRPEHLLG